MPDCRTASRHGCSALATALLCAACAAPIHPTPVGPDSYTLDARGLTEQNNVGVLSTGEQKLRLFEAAARYCAQQGRQSELLAERVKDTRWSKMALAEIDFRCVAP